MSLLLQRADGSLVGLAVLLGISASFQCDVESQDASCITIDVEQVPARYCAAAFRCRDEFTLSDDEFVERFGADREECRTLEHDFVTQASSMAETANGTVDPELENCVAALSNVSCAEVQSDALVEEGRPCHPDVIGGNVDTDEQYPLCGDDSGDGGC